MERCCPQSERLLCLLLALPADQHPSNGFLHMEQSASMFHFHTAMACHRLYFSFIADQRAKQKQRQRQRGNSARGEKTAPVKESS